MKISEEARSFAYKAVTEWNQDRIAEEVQKLLDNDPAKNWKTTEQPVSYDSRLVTGSG